MSGIGTPEKQTQQRIIKLFTEQLGYRYVGDWTDRQGNTNIEEQYLTAHLSASGYSEAEISRALFLLRQAANNNQGSLYDINKAVYSLLRYGVDVKTDPSQPTDTVHLINWANPEANDFAIAEEVTLKGGLERRPDLVLYLNGIAIGVIELKNSRVTIGDGIRQLLSNQLPAFNAWFFGTTQVLFAGSDSEGLKYGTIGTPEKYYLRWKEDEADNVAFKIDKYLSKMCAKERLLELMHDFVVFDGGVKKLPRVHQYFGIKAAQDNVRRREGGIIWHTQGSGKSIVMVLLAKWLLENNPNARIAIITDRDELDKQIEGVFADAGESIYRTSSGQDLINQLGQATPRLLCSLVHKFGQRGVDDFDAFIAAIEASPSRTVGEVFVFVDECHRTQSGKLHRAMKALMPNAVFVGFTGTPLLKRDRATSLEIFGRYIHTYKFSEAVEDQVVLDLVYEARDIDQRLSSPDKIEQWFAAKTKGLNQWQRDALKEQWGTMQRVLSSRARIDKVVADILFDFSVKPRLSSHRGNAILVASSIFEACKYFEAFQKTPLKGKSALVTSYQPNAQDVTKEETGANTQTDRQFIYDTYKALLAGVTPQRGMSETETYEERAKTLFVEQPANMKLLVVVDKLLTGFDAPSCTYLYIDKSMQDHGLFQAICRTNRLDGDDKDFGYIVDYQRLLKKVEKAIAVYSSELDTTSGGVDPAVLIKDRLEKGKQQLDAALEVMALNLVPVSPPKGELEHIHYYCGNSEIAADLAATEARRAELYKAVSSLVRAYAALADELDEAGYGSADITRIKNAVSEAVNVRDIVRNAANETIDLKAYEADMRHLIDTYIEADDPRKISALDNVSLLDLVVKSGIGDAIVQKLASSRRSEAAVAETIENNVRSTIVKKQITDPLYFAKLSTLLDEIIKKRKEKALDYEAYLKELEELIRRVVRGVSEDAPPRLDTAAKRALFNNLGQDEEKALALDAKIRLVRPADWRGDEVKERILKRAIFDVLGDEDAVEALFPIVNAQQEY